MDVVDALANVMKFTVFIPEPEFEASHKLLEEVAEVRTGKAGEVYTEDRLVDEVRNVNALIITSQHHVTRKVIEAATRLKVIVKYGSKPGLDNMDLEAATENGIVVSYTPDANSDSVAEHTITLMLALLKRLYLTSYLLRRGEWRRRNLLGHELRQKTIGVIGLGTIGRKVAKKLTGFEVKLLAYDPYVPKGDGTDIGVRLVDLRTLLNNSDIITIHANLTLETTHLIGAKELGLVKKGAFIINTARGAIIDERV